MTINLAPLNQKLTVQSFASTETSDISDIESRLMHLGFIYGATVMVKRRAPLFKEPILVEVRGRMVALSAEEAMLVQVQEQK